MAQAMSCGSMTAPTRAAWLISGLDLAIQILLIWPCITVHYISALTPMTAQAMNCGNTMEQTSPARLISGPAAIRILLTWRYTMACYISMPMATTAADKSCGDMMALLPAAFQNPMGSAFQALLF